MTSSKRVVYAALIANFLIAIAKFIAATVTGSSAMLSETYHSISDTGNQVLLLLGIRMSERRPTKRHPFGYGKEQFFFSFVVSVMLFGVAGYASLTEGYHRLHEGGAVEQPLISLSVLAVAFLFEGYAFSKALAGFRREVAEFGGVVDAFRDSSDAPLLTALTEDTVALVGIAAAAAGVVLTYYTGNHVYDAAASIFIGVMLMGFAVALGWENRKLLIGEAVPPSERRRMMSLLGEREEVDNVIDLKTMTLGPDSVLAVAEIRFVNGLTTDQLEKIIEELEANLQDAFPEVTSVYVEVT